MYLVTATTVTLFLIGKPKVYKKSKPVSGGNYEDIEFG
jgi:hypothetical protein